MRVSQGSKWQCIVTIQVLGLVEARVLITKLKLFQNWKGSLEGRGHAAISVGPRPFGRDWGALNLTNPQPEPRVHDTVSTETQRWGKKDF